MTLLLAACWFSFLGVMVYVFERQTRWLSRFSVFTVMLGALFLRYGITVPFTADVNATVTGVPLSRPQLQNYYFSLVLMYLFVSIGISLVQRFTFRFSVAQLAATPVDQRLLIGAATIVLALVVLVWIILPWPDFIAGLSSVFGSGHSTASYRLHRVTYGNKTLPGSSLLNYLGSFSRFAILPVILWVLYFHRHRWKCQLLFWISLAVLGVIGVLSGQKLPALLLVLGFVIARLIIAGRPSLLNWKFLFGGLVFIGVLLPVLYHLQYPTWSYPRLVGGSIFRLSEENNRTAQLRYAFYPDRHPFLLGFGSFIVRTAARHVGVNTGDAESPETYIPSHVANVGPSYGGTWNAGFFAEAWADFGFIGVVLASTLVGAIVMLIYLWYERGPVGPLENGTYTAVCVSALYISDVSLTTAIWTFGLLSSFLVFWFLSLVSTRFQGASISGRPETPVTEGRA